MRHFLNSKWRIFISSGIIYFLLRLITINAIPIFNDEAIYLKWGNDFWDRPPYVTVPLSIDGKQAGVPYVYGLVQQLPFDPLTSSRMVNVAVSFITYISVMLTGMIWLSNIQLIVLSILLIFCPYLLLFDRMALPDGIITAFYSMCLYITIYLVKKPKTIYSILLGIILAVGWWFKSTIYLAFLPIGAIFIYLFYTRRKERFYIISLFLILVAVFYLLIAPLLYHSLYQSMTHIETKRILSFGEFLTFPIQIWRGNLEQIIRVLGYYINPFIWLFLTISILKIRKDKKIFFLAGWILLPLAFELFLLKSIDARYMVLVIPPIMILVAKGLELRGNFANVLKVLMVILVVVYGILFSFYPLKFYQWVGVRPIDFGQYVEAWASGYGVAQAVEYIKEREKGKEAIVFVRHDSGNPEDSMYVYFHKEKNILVQPVFFLDEIMENKDNLIFKNPSFYFVSRGRQYAGLEERLNELAKFKKPMGSEFVGVYEIDYITRQ